MITRGIVTYSDSDNIKVYIPILQGKVDSKYLTETDFNNRFQGLKVVSVLSTPGINVSYKPGDIVLVGFQDNEMSSVVILGYLGSAINNSQGISIKANNLTAIGDINLSTKITFGDNTLDFNNIFSFYDNLDNLSWTTIFSVDPSSPKPEPSKLKSGWIRYCKIGKFICVNFEELQFNQSEYPGGLKPDNILIENLPKGNSHPFLLTPFANPSIGSIRLAIVNGVCYGWWTTVDTDNMAKYYGSICYSEGEE